MGAAGLQPPPQIEIEKKKSIDTMISNCYVIYLSAEICH